MKIIVSLILCAIWFFPIESHANGQTGELSVMGSYSKTNYGAGSYSTSRRYQAAAGLNLTPVTEIEISFMMSDSYINNDPIQSITEIHDKTASASLIQSLVPPQWVIQPYVKAGGAQYNREQKNSIQGIPQTPSFTKSPSGLLGVGVRIFLLRNFSLKVEAVEYLPDMKLKEGHNNLFVQGGIGWYF